MTFSWLVDIVGRYVGLLSTNQRILVIINQQWFILKLFMVIWVIWVSWVMVYHCFTHIGSIYGLGGLIFEPRQAAARFVPLASKWRNSFQAAARNAMPERCILDIYCTYVIRRLYVQCMYIMCFLYVYLHTHAHTHIYIYT